MNKWILKYSTMPTKLYAHLFYQNKYIISQLINDIRPDWSFDLKKRAIFCYMTNYFHDISPNYKIFLLIKLDL